MTQLALLESAQDLARELLGPYESVIRDAIARAWDRWRDRPPAEFLTLDARARAAMMWCYMKDEVTRALAVIEGVVINERGGTCNYIVGNQFMFRLKKLNGRGRSRNFPTPSSVQYYAQLEFEGMPQVVRLDIGYVLNRTRTGILQILVSCPLDKRIVWTYPLRTDADDVAIASITPVEGGAPRVSRVRRPKTNLPESGGSAGD